MIVGTAGHVDHGKTTLVKALTGVDTDRLPEERRRGMTLELGFAPLQLADGRQASIIDVPGHERLVRTMAAGAGGIDVALLVIAADEGVQPQTLEHLQVLTWLGVPRGLVVFTRVDRATGPWREAVEAQLRPVVQGTCFEGAGRFEVDARAGVGIDALRAAIGALEVPPPKRWLPLLLPVDRAFTLQGRGRVVTGTLWSGTIARGALLQADASGPALRVRAMQCHGRDIEHAQAGMRVALQLADLQDEGALRGATLCHAGELEPVRDLDVAMEGGAAPRRRVVPVALTLGTAQLEAEVRWLDDGGPFAQLRLPRAAAVLPGMRFIARATGTWCGGRVVAVAPPRRRARDVERVRRLASDVAAERLEALLEDAGALGRTRTELFARMQLASDALEALLQHPQVTGTTTVGQTDALAHSGGSGRPHARAASDTDPNGAGEVVSGSAARFVATAVVTHLARRLAALVTGPVPLATARQHLGGIPDGTWQAVLATATQGHGVALDHDTLRPTGSPPPRLSPQQQQMLALLTERGLRPPTLDEWAARLHVNPRAVSAVAQQLVASGHAVRAGTLYFARACVEDLERRLRDHFTRHERLTPADFKALTGVSRKFWLPLLERFDAEQVTLRVGDTRVLRGPAQR